MNGYTVSAVYGTITGTANVGCLLNKPIQDGKKCNIMPAADAAGNEEGHQRGPAEPKGSRETAIKPQERQ